MSWMLYDPDEWEAVVDHQSYGTFYGHPIGMSSYGQRRRSPEEVARIKRILSHDKAGRMPPASLGDEITALLALS